MKNPLLTPSLWAALALHAAAAAPPQSVAFANGDFLAGSLENIDRDHIVWRTPALSGTFKTDQIVSITIPQTVRPDAKDIGPASITLNNGDVLHGDLSSVTDAAVILSTPFAGDLSIVRAMVKSITIENHPRVLYLGPASLEEWTASTGNWTFADNTLHSSSHGAIFRDLALPEMCSISFDIEDFQDSQDVHATLFSEGVEKNLSGYDFSFSRGYLTMRRLSKDINRNIAGMGMARSMQVPQLAEADKASIEIRADRKNGKFQILVSGHPVATWEDIPADKEVQGTGLRFSSFSALHLSHIRATTWDGVVLPTNEEPDAKPAADEHKGDKPADTKQQLHLRNGDVLAGDVLSIRDGAIRIKTEFGEVTLPISRMTTIALNNSEYNEPKRMSGDIRATFLDGGSVTFRLDGSSDGKIRGYSQCFGNAEFRLDAFSKIDFNIYPVLP